MRVQLKKSSQSELHKREALTQRNLGLEGCCEPPSRARAEPWWGRGGKAPGKFCVFSSKNALDWLILSHFLPLIL